MEEKEFAEAWKSHLDYLAKHPPFCQFCGKHHLDLENCLTCHSSIKLIS